MATGFEKLDKQLDRLEKLFSKRKKSAEPQGSAVIANRPATPVPFLTELRATSQMFPQPSYIRPTSSRMVAREEVLLTPSSARRARSLPETPSTPRLPTLAPPSGPEKTSGTETSDDYPRASSRLSPLGPDIPKRTSSLFSGGSANDTMSELLGFTFPAVPKAATASSSPKRRSGSSSKSMARSTSRSVSPKGQVNRRQYPGTEDGLSLPQQQDSPIQQNTVRRYKSSSSLLFPGESRHGHLGQPLSPRLAPLPEPGLDELDNGHSSVSETPRSSSASQTAIKDYRSLRKCRRTSKLPIAKQPSQTPILKEPTVTDFLALSDDDIADGHTAIRAHNTITNPPEFALPPDPSPTATSRLPKATYPLLTLSPPLASRPATAAALEAARIASKFHFDLVYVVNLWPSHVSRPSRSSPLSELCGTPVATSAPRSATPSPPATPLSSTSGDDSAFEGRASRPRSNQRSGMTGRLLAAYGLPSIMYPFRISAPVHQKVLRTEGWLEYRNETGAQDEFACGYSCSFYTGYSPARRSDADTVTTPDGKRRKLKAKPANRGIVFAAFRLPRGDGSPVASDPDELEMLAKDAEALVDMLIDTHMTHRQRTSPGTPRRCAGTENGRALKQGPPLVAP